MNKTLLIVSTFLFAGCMSTPLRLKPEYKAVRAPAASMAQDQVRVAREMPTGTGVRVLGSYSIAADHGFFHNYKSGWRNVYCGAQRPMVFMTLFVWELVPTYWPCYKDARYPKAELQAAAVELAAKAGGDVVVIEFVDSEGRAAKGVRGYVVQERTSGSR